MRHVMPSTVRAVVLAASVVCGVWDSGVAHAQPAGRVRKPDGRQRPDFTNLNNTVPDGPPKPGGERGPGNRPRGNRPPGGGPR